MRFDRMKAACSNNPPSTRSGLLSFGKAFLLRIVILSILRLITLRSYFILFSLSRKLRAFSISFFALG